MKKLLLFLGIVAFLFSGEYSNKIVKTNSGFIMEPITPRPCKMIEKTSTGFLFHGKIIWGEPTVGANKVGDPYKNGMVFVSESKTRAWEFVCLTNDNGEFSVPIKPSSGFRLYAWDGSGKILAMYDGHFYYNPKLKNLYRVPKDDLKRAVIDNDSDVTIVNN